ncbi:hypothetical protein FUAX_46880 (plasmid) [Fulvitalea axinellae]|uniref:YcxB-like protein domain-containing protein n=1 Tax=Fulvitalea axinellae TaxID=1182444 RepID=A0AAU9CT33_9BACT|nr:hypothetical protein FUAX_46880 [Fulvitalea axinellae]
MEESYIVKKKASGVIRVSSRKTIVRALKDAASGIRENMHLKLLAGLGAAALIPLATRLFLGESGMVVNGLAALCITLLFFPLKTFLWTFAGAVRSKTYEIGENGIVVESGTLPWSLVDRISFDNGDFDVQYGDENHFYIPVSAFGEEELLQIKTWAIENGRSGHSA